MSTTRIQGVDGNVLTGKWASRVFGILLGLAAWYALAFAFPEDLMPFPLELIASIRALMASGALLPNLLASLSRAVWGFLGACVVGITLGVVMGINEFGKNFFLPYILIGITIPGVVWALITTLIYGFGALAPTLAIILATAPFIALYIWKAVENIDPDLVKMSESFDISFVKMVRRLILPSVAPSVFAALRFGLAVSLKIEVITELFATNRGVGVRTVEAFDSFQYSRAWAWATVFIALILVLEFAILQPLGERVFEYRSDADFDTIR